jgi:glutamate-ammonia-ligase adenylyltransferase
MADSTRPASDPENLRAEAQAHPLLDPIHFDDRAAALAVLHHLSVRYGDEFDVIYNRLLSALDGAADPDRSLVCFERFAENYGPGLFSELDRNPRVIEILVTLFSASQFLSEILVRDPQHLDVLTHRERLSQQKSADKFQAEALRMSAGLAPAEQLNGLRRYQRSEILRIGACDLLDLYDLPAVTLQLSNLADGLTRACLAYAGTQTGIDPDGFTVLALGKLGGQELNYSSDIDLSFVCADDTKEYIHLGQQLIEALSGMTSEGFLYRVDMRLRPWGRDGTLVTTIEGYMTYLYHHARMWEKQALLKARPIAGDLALGDEFLRQIEPIIFGANTETVRASVHAMKQRTEEILRSKNRNWGEVKLGEGSIRDVEFVVQFLQLAFGGQNPKLRKKATLRALRRLVRYQLLTASEGRVLTDGYIFLRTVEHFLQMMHYRQTHTLPSDPAAIDLLARRLGFRGTHTAPERARDQFLERYQQHCLAIRAIYSKYIGGIDIPPTPEPDPSVPTEDVLRLHVARMDASYAAAFSADEIHRHAALADRLTDDQLVLVDVKQLDETQWQVTVVAYDYLGELSLICGLMFVYGLDIQDGQIFTYEPEQKPEARYDPAAVRFPPLPRLGRRSRARAADTTPSPSRRKIVDVFTVRPVRSEAPSPVLWQSYSDDLHALLKMMHTGQRREARSELAKRVGAAFTDVETANEPLYPIEIKIDNDVSERYTVLHLETRDTVGFLYEFTNALSLTHIYIARMEVHTHGRRVDDLLYVTDEDGKKITSPEKQRELRTAAVLIKHFTHLLPRSPNPASALLHFREFLDQLFARPNWPDELASLENPDVMNNLARLLGVSDFLWDDFMRMQYANLFPVVSDTASLKTAKSRAELQAELERALKVVHDKPQPPHENAPWRRVLNEFKDREMFRIDMRHILGHTREFWDFSAELTDLAEVIVNSAYHLTAEDLRFVHGTPRLDDGSLSQMAVLALGKCGGCELGFASDIELMFVYAGEGRTDGRESILSSLFHEKVVESFLNAIRARQEGIFQVDLQLRPYGKAGSMAVSLESFRRYYDLEGPAWAYERQALVKMRPIAGDETLGRDLCLLRDEFVYNGLPFDVTAMRAMRERQERHLVTAGKFNAKYSPGGLVDVEYLIQGLQINHGAADPSLRLTNIRAAMAALNEAGILSGEDYTKLHKAHTFLRWLIDSMRMVRGNAKDVDIPAYGSEEFAFLARRLRYGSDIDRLQEDLLRYQTDVQEINRRLLR